MLSFLRSIFVSPFVHRLTHARVPLGAATLLAAQGCVFDPRVEETVLTMPADGVAVLRIESQEQSNTIQIKNTFVPAARWSLFFSLEQPALGSFRGSDPDALCAESTFADCVEVPGAGYLVDELELTAPGEVNLEHSYGSVLGATEEEESGFAYEVFEDAYYVLAAENPFEPDTIANVRLDVRIESLEWVDGAQAIEVEQLR